MQKVLDKKNLANLLISDRISKGLIGVKFLSKMKAELKIECQMKIVTIRKRRKRKKKSRRKNGKKSIKTLLLGSRSLQVNPLRDSKLNKMILNWSRKSSGTQNDRICKNLKFNL